MTLTLSDFSYDLPHGSIAHIPAIPRDHSHLLLVNRVTQTLKSYHFYDLPQILQPGDVLVLNQTKVFPARLMGKKSTGGKQECLLLSHVSATTWHALVKPGIKQVGLSLTFSSSLQANVIKLYPDGTVDLCFTCPPDQMYPLLYLVGQTPLPPYIPPVLPEKKVRRSYQTVYAKLVGSAAAPTAGLHFTQKLLKAIKVRGVQIEKITLHVGLGTFQRLRHAVVAKNHLHPESYFISKKTALHLNQAQANGQRIISVGTTTTRALESEILSGAIRPGHHSTSLFIYPPYAFKFVSGLITNFHLPESSLLMLIAAFTSAPQTPLDFSTFSTSLMGQAYSQSLKQGYRFFSFGDASLIL